MLSDMDKTILSQTIASYCTELAGHLDLSLFEAESWLTVFCDELHKSYIRGTMVIAFVFKLDSKDYIKLTHDNLKNFTENGKEVVNINLKHELSLCDDLLSADELHISEYGESSQKVIFRLEAEILKIYYDGRLRKRINIAHPLSTAEQRLPKHARKCADYKLVIEDHNKKHLVNRMDIYWSDKKKRILKGGKTEGIFQQSLFEWLDLYIYDATTKIETKTNAGDRTDIDIYAYLKGQHYVIEVKWLGINENNTKYDASRIMDGIGQIATYLKRDSNITEACLVCYDGRTEEKYHANKHVEKSEIPPKGDCVIIFLESESASKKGKQYVNTSKLES